MYMERIPFKYRAPVISEQIFKKESVDDDNFAHSRIPTAAKMMA